MSIPATVFVIDPDRTATELVAALAKRMDLPCETYVNGNDFLARYDRNKPGCLILEICVPGASGFQIQQRLVDVQAPQPIIFLTTASSASIAVHAMRMGALHFIEKPFHEHEMWSAIQEAIEADQKWRNAHSAQEAIRTKLDELSEKEFAVLAMVGEGKSKNEIARSLGVAIRTVEHHRTKLMRKLKINSPPGLLRFAMHATQTNGWHKESAPALSDGNGFSRFDTGLHSGAYSSLQMVNGLKSHAVREMRSERITAPADHLPLETPAVRRVPK